ncbi:MAG: DUF302 domain-containing protein [Myxococcales bacterium]|nr:DUF302 domain-containing protein [Myxococcales bacterium]MDP3499857.1 DUF302 domain-containing protein [Myxococcales bacterium]
MSDLKKTLTMSYEQALARVPEALKAEGFGVLTSIDMKDTLKKKLDVDFRRYTILGACNPPLALEALTTSLEVGTLLPCNVIVYEEGTGSVVQAVDPTRSVGALEDPRFLEVAHSVRSKLQKVINAL